MIDPQQLDRMERQPHVADVLPLVQEVRRLGEGIDALLRDLHRYERAYGPDVPEETAGG